MHLLHSNISNLFTVCVLSYKVYCAYTPSKGAMALLNKISVSVFRILSEGLVAPKTNDLIHVQANGLSLKAW